MMGNYSRRVTLFRGILKDLMNFSNDCDSPFYIRGANNRAHLNSTLVDNLSCYVDIMFILSDDKTFYKVYWLDGPGTDSVRIEEIKIKGDKIRALYLKDINCYTFSQLSTIQSLLKKDKFVVRFGALMFAKFPDDSHYFNSNKVFGTFIKYVVNADLINFKPYTVHRRDFSYIVDLDLSGTYSMPVYSDPVVAAHSMFERGYYDWTNVVNTFNPKSYTIDFKMLNALDGSKALNNIKALNRMLPIIPNISAFKGSLLIKVYSDVNNNIKVARSNSKDILSYGDDANIDRFLELVVSCCDKTDFSINSVTIVNGCEDWLVSRIGDNIWYRKAEGKEDEVDVVICM